MISVNRVKTAEIEEMASYVDEFLKSGGTIKQIPNTQSGIPIEGKANGKYYHIHSRKNKDA